MEHTPTYMNPTQYQPFTPAYMTAPNDVVVRDFSISWSRMFALQFKFWVVATIFSFAATILWVIFFAALLT